VVTWIRSHRRAGGPVWPRRGCASAHDITHFLRRDLGHGGRMGTPWTALLVVAPALFGCGGSGIGSIGAVLGRDPENGALHVRGVPEGNAADLAGVLPGDEIVFVDGRDVRELEVPALRALLRGEPGSKVDLTLLRDGRVVRVRVARAPLAATPPKKPEGEEKMEE
jgi:S1-C subfamily serine protease